MMVLVRVASASEAAERDAAATASGVPSLTLMQRAGIGAAAEIRRRYADRLVHGVRIYAGQGNNGGDAWVVAGVLAGAGVRVAAMEAGEARTEDAALERGQALPLVTMNDDGPCGIVVDGLLGTGSRGAPRGHVAELISHLLAAREAGAAVVALDVPSGVDATTGERHDPHIVADLTITFGTLKRGLLRARDASGRIVVLDIGLPEDEDPTAPRLVCATWVAERLPLFLARAHKGTRKKLVIVGGARGMAGAVALATRASLRSGVGMVRALVAPESVAVVQGGVHEALAGEWPAGEGAADTVRELVCDWADGVLIGPGLGAERGTRRLVETVLRLWHGPVVLDADALNVFAGDADDLGALLTGRPALITPHVMEFARLSGLPREDVDARHFDAGSELARRLGATILLKGVPTVITEPDGARLVSASGTPALATAGSGDVLAGIAATLLAQLRDAPVAGACAAWVHGRAAEIAGAGRPLRGVSLSDVIDALALAWPRRGEGAPAEPLLAELAPPVEGW